MDQIYNKTVNYVERFNKFGFYDDSNQGVTKAVEIRK